MTYFFIIPTLTIGGAESVCVKTCNEMKASGEEVQLLVFTNKVEYLLHPGIVLNKFIGFSGFFKYLKFCYRNKHNGVFISYMERANFFNLISHVLTGVRNLYLTVHTAPRSGFGNRTYTKQCIIYLLYKISSILNLKVITVSNGIANELKSLYKIRNISILYNFIDTLQYEDVITIRQKNARLCFPSNNSVSLLFVGRLTPVKGCDVLLESLKRCVSNKNITLTIVGDGPMRTVYEQYVCNEGLVEQVNFVGKVNNVKSFMLNADYLVVPSYAEGFGMVILEGLLSGCSIVYSECNFGPKELMSQYFSFVNSYAFSDPSISRSKSIEELSVILSNLSTYSLNVNVYEKIVDVINTEFSSNAVIKKLKSMVD